MRIYEGAGRCFYNSKRHAKKYRLRDFENVKLFSEYLKEPNTSIFPNRLITLCHCSSGCLVCDHYGYVIETSFEVFLSALKSSAKYRGFK